MRFLMQLYADRSGATAIEYGLLAALIALAIIGTLISIGDHVLAYFAEANSGFKT